MSLKEEFNSAYVKFAGYFFSKISIVAAFEILNVLKIFHSLRVGTFIYCRAEFYVSDCWLIGYCHKTEANERFCKATVLFCLLQKLLHEQMLHIISRSSYRSSLRNHNLRSRIISTAPHVCSSAMLVLEVPRN
jgi:hypothetical protein